MRGDRGDPDPAPVGAGNAVISCDLGILVEEAAESLASLNAGAGVGGRGHHWLLSSGDEVLARSWPTARRSTVVAARASRAAHKSPQVRAPAESTTGNPRTKRDYAAHGGTVAIMAI